MSEHFSGALIANFIVSLLYLGAVYGIALILIQRILKVDLPKDSLLQALSFIPILLIGFFFLYCLVEFGHLHYDIIFKDHHGEWAFAFKYWALGFLFLVLVAAPSRFISFKSLKTEKYYRDIVNFFIVAITSFFVVSFLKTVTSKNGEEGDFYFWGIILIILISKYLSDLNKKVFFDSIHQKKIKKAQKLGYNNEDSAEAIRLLEEAVKSLRESVDDNSSIKPNELIAWRYYYLNKYESAMKQAHISTSPYLALTTSRIDRIDPYIMKAMIYYKKNNNEVAFGNLAQAMWNIKVFHLPKSIGIVELILRNRSKRITRKTRHKYPKIKDLKKIYQAYTEIQKDDYYKFTRAYYVIGIFLYFQKKFNEAKYWFDQYLQVHKLDNFPEKSDAIEKSKEIDEMELASNHP